MKTHLIYIGIILILAGIIGYGAFRRNNNINLLKNKNKALEEEKESLLFDLKERDIVIDMLSEDISSGKKKIDSLKNIENEIKTPDIINIPIDERNRTIENISREE